MIKSSDNSYILSTRHNYYSKKKKKRNTSKNQYNKKNIIHSVSITINLRSIFENYDQKKLIFVSNR